MRSRRGRLDSWGAFGASVVLGLVGCSIDVPEDMATGGTAASVGGATTAGTPASTGGTPTAAGTATGGTGTSGSPAMAGSGGAVTSTGGNASGAPAAGGAGGGAGTGSAGGAGTPATVACTGFVFCDDFESYTAGAAPNGKWKAQVRGSAQAVVDTTMAYSGTKSVHFTGTVNQSSANIIAQGAPVFPIQGDKIYLRMMMYTKTYPATSGTHTRLMRIGISTNGADGSAYALDTYNGTAIEHINSGMFRNTSLHLNDAAVTNKWVCWEWALDNTAGPPPGDTGTVMAYIWRDGTAVSLSVTNDKLPWNPIAWQLLEIGLEAYQADPVPGDFWIDDVAVSNTKVGCPSK